MTSVTSIMSESPVASVSSDAVARSSVSPRKRSHSKNPLELSECGVLHKRSMRGESWEERHCILKSGIFCYFRTEDKLSAFRRHVESDSLKKTEASLSEKRKQFRKALSSFPPRGFIKLLNGQGMPVSRVAHDYNRFFVTHLESKRTFELKCPDKSTIRKWTAAFQKIGVIDHSSATLSVASEELAATSERGIDESVRSVSVPQSEDDAALRRLEDDERRIQRASETLKQEAEQSMTKLTKEFSQWLA